MYDPLGLATLYTIKLNLLMKDTLAVDNPGDWDSPVSASLIKEWSTALKEGIGQDSLYFLQSTMRIRVVKKPRLVGFWDGSSQAFSAAIYSVTMVSELKELSEEDLPDGDLEDRDFNPKEHKSISHIIVSKA